jgi:hypothetical protein
MSGTRSTIRGQTFMDPFLAMGENSPTFAATTSQVAGEVILMGRSLPLSQSLANPFTFLSAVGNPMYGYRNDTRPQPQTFEQDNIVILSDGSCGSTCAIFSELLKTQAGVQSIAVGGRSQ